MYYIIVYIHTCISFIIHICEEEEREYDGANDTKWKHLVNLGKEFFVFLKLK